MTLAAGTRLGPYEILSPLGAGGMGEVYRARDERLKRDVAVKVLPASFSADADRLRRFEQEAQTAGGLNHPNITAVYDLGSHDGAPYIVTELLEGETLRARLSGGALPVRKATDYAIQIAKGLAAAHEKGIVHRDLKPENLFVTNDGRVKILDFGLAKLTQKEGDASPQTNLPTATQGTEPGVVLGTLGYMSPEQVKGKAADARSDIFSFGAILYEMVSGQRAFHRASAAETMSAILREEPPDLSATNKAVTPGLERVVRHCLEKSPEERFHSAHDLAFDLEALSGHSGTAVASAATPARRLRLLPIAAGVLALSAALGTGFFLGRSKGHSDPPAFRQLTFRHGVIWGARFGSDGKSILTTAAWDGKPAEIYVSRPESPEARPFGIPNADVAAVSPSGDVAVLLRSDFDGPFTRAGTLARVGATGGAPRELLENIEYADFAPDGQTLAIVRVVDGKRRLEQPPGKVLYETAGWIGNPRISPKGDRIAFLDHPVTGDDGGLVAIVDRSGRKTTVSPYYASTQGLAWSPDGSEVWYTGAEVGGNRAMFASSSSGRRRVLARVTGSLTLHDVGRDGRVLVSHDVSQVGILARAAGAAQETDVAWLDWSLVDDISGDGRTILFSEAGEGGGAGYSVYLRRMDGSPAVRLGEGNGQSLSRDGKWAVALVGPPGGPEIVLYPTGAGEPRKIPFRGGVVRAARWVSDGRLLVVARGAGGTRVHVVEVSGGTSRAVTPEGYLQALPSPDGRRFVCRGPDRAFYLGSIDGGALSKVEGVDAADSVQDWASDGLLYVEKGSQSVLPMHVYRVDPATGRKGDWRDLGPANMTGLSRLSLLRVADNGAYAYNYFRGLSDLYLVERLR